MSYTCVICLNNKELDTLMINIRCGHACICQECQNNLPNIVFTEKSYSDTLFLISLHMDLRRLF